MNMKFSTHTDTHGQFYTTNDKYVIHYISNVNLADNQHGVWSNYQPIKQSINHIYDRDMNKIQ